MRHSLWANPAMNVANKRGRPAVGPAPSRRQTDGLRRAWDAAPDACGNRVRPALSLPHASRSERNGEQDRRPRRVSARLPRHLRDAGDGRKRARNRSARRRRPSAHCRQALHQGRAIPGAHVFEGPRAASDAPRRAARAKAASSASRGTRRSRRSPSALARSPGRRTGRRRSFPIRMPGRWDSCSPRRWTGASSIGSAHRCSTGRSAPPPARPAGPRRSARRSAPTSSR